MDTQQQGSTAPISTPEKTHGSAVAFLTNIVRGAAIGVAFIIPGFSGGSVAAVLGIYDRLVGSVAGIFRDFKRSVLFLLPVALGMLLGIAAFVIPILWALGSFPMPTVSLFVGLSLGGLPSVAARAKGKWHFGYAVAALVAGAACASLAFCPIGADVELFSLDVGGYLLLVLVGAAGACALVVPGISGSMLYLILGYYTPLVKVVTEHLLLGAEVGKSVLIIACVGVGLVVGFFAISVFMKFLLKKFPRGTFAAIIGLIVGSVPLVYVSVVRRYASLAGLYSNPWYWVISCVMLLLGAALSYLLFCITKKNRQ